MTRRVNQRQAGYDRCRAWGHAWYEQDAPKAPMFGYYQWLQCESCGTLRRDIVDRNGNLLSRSYEYDDDYKNNEGYTREDFRARLLAPRIVEEDGHATVTPIRRAEATDKQWERYLQKARLTLRSAQRQAHSA